MNKEEVKFDHFKDIEELIKHLEMWYAEDDYFAYERYFHLRDARIMGMFIYELQQENKKLKEINEEYKKLNGELREENKKCKEVIDKAILIIKGIAYGGNEDYYIEKLKDILKEVE